MLKLNRTQRVSETGIIIISFMTFFLAMAFSTRAAENAGSNRDSQVMSAPAGSQDMTNEDNPLSEDQEELDDWEDLEETADIWDPFESFNRYMFTFNDRLYFWGVKPAATAYSWVMPEPLREGVRNGWYNLATPVRLANCLFQMKFRDAGVEVARFFINTIMGIGGIGDPAARIFNLHRANEDMGQTFGTWGVGFGPYLVLPFIGPSCPRDAIGMLGDSYLYPLNYYIGKIWQDVSIRAGKELNNRSLQLGEYEDFKASSLDPYVAVRSAYYQLRQNEINSSSDDFKSFTFQ